MVQVDSGHLEKDYIASNVGVWKLYFEGINLFFWS